MRPAALLPSRAVYAALLGMTKSPIGQPNASANAQTLVNIGSFSPDS